MATDPGSTKVHRITNYETGRVRYVKTGDEIAQQFQALRAVGRARWAARASDDHAALRPHRPAAATA